MEGPEEERLATSQQTVSANEEQNDVLLNSRRSFFFKECPIKSYSLIKRFNQIYETRKHC